MELTGNISLRIFTVVGRLTHHCAEHDANHQEGIDDFLLSGHFFKWFWVYNNPWEHGKRVIHKLNCSSVDKSMTNDGNGMNDMLTVSSVFIVNALHIQDARDNRNWRNANSSRHFPFQSNHSHSLICPFVWSFIHSVFRSFIQLDTTDIQTYIHTYVHMLLTKFVWFILIVAY